MFFSKSEFVDVMRKGNLGCFCNYLCNFNCYVDKWVVGDKLWMGIFVLRKILVGEEFVFNYNVDWYGVDFQLCYCGEFNCVGFIGGKIQIERVIKFFVLIVEVFGIDVGDGWDILVVKKLRKKWFEEDDEEYVNSIQLCSLDEEDVCKVMVVLVQCKEKWIVVKLLEWIQCCDEECVIYCVMCMYVYQIFKIILNIFSDDINVVF